MIVYYGRAGWYANLALLVNLLFLFGILASLNAVLTLPGIAGIVLTLGTAVDANIIIYERAKEELRHGLSLAEAVKKSFSWTGAMRSIIDANVTHVLTGAIFIYVRNRTNQRFRYDFIDRYCYFIIYFNFHHKNVIG